MLGDITGTQTHSQNRIDFHRFSERKCHFKLIRLICSQQLDASLFTDRRKIAEENLFLHGLVVQKVENSRWSAENEKVKLRFLSCFERSWNVKALGEHSLTRCSHWDPSVGRWATHNFTNVPVASEPGLLFLPLSSPNPANMLPEPKEKWFLCCWVWFRSTLSMFHPYRLYFIFFYFFFGNAGCLWYHLERSGLFSKAQHYFQMFFFN